MCLNISSLQPANSLYIGDQCSVMPLLIKALQSNKPSTANPSEITADLVLATQQQFRSDTLLRLQTSVFSSDVVAASALYCAIIAPIFSRIVSSSTLQGVLTLMPLYLFPPGFPPTLHKSFDWSCHAFLRHVCLLFPLQTALSGATFLPR